MKKIVFFVLMLAGCATYHQEISSYHKIDSLAKTVAMESSNTTDVYQDFNHALQNAGFKIYNRDDRNVMARYELSGDINKDDSVRCGLWEDGYTYDLTFIDHVKKTDVFGMQGQGCRENILTDFTALIDNRYDEKNEAIVEPESDDVMRAPSLKSDGRTWWGN